MITFRLSAFRPDAVGLLTVYVAPDQLALVVPPEMLRDLAFWFARWENLVPRAFSSRKLSQETKHQFGCQRDLLLLSESSSDPATWAAMTGLTHTMSDWLELVRLYLDQIKPRLGYSAEINTSPQAVRWFDYTVHHCHELLRQYNFVYNRALLHGFCHYLRNTILQESKERLLHLLEFCVRCRILSVEQVASVFSIQPSQAIKIGAQIRDYDTPGWLKKAFDCSTVSAEFAADRNLEKDKRFAATSAKVRSLLKFPNSNASLFSPKPVAVVVAAAPPPHPLPLPTKRPLEHDWYPDDDELNPPPPPTDDEPNKRTTTEVSQSSEDLSLPQMPTQEDIQFAYALALSMKEK